MPIYTEVSVGRVNEWHRARACSIDINKSCIGLSLYLSFLLFFYSFIFIECFLSFSSPVIPRILDLSRLIKKNIYYIRAIFLLRFDPSYDRNIIIRSSQKNKDSRNSIINHLLKYRENPWSSAIININIILNIIINNILQM